MNRLTIIIILLVLIPISVEALYVKDEKGNNKKCTDIKTEEWHNYVIKYNHPDYPEMGPDSYVVVDSEGYPKPMYEEKGISPYGYYKDYTANEYSTKFNQYREQHRLTEPEGKHLYTRYMGWVPFNLNDASFDMAYQQFLYEYFVPTDDCIPCTERGLTEYYGDCITCYERWGDWSPFFSYDPDKIVAGKKGYYGCFPCPEGTKWDGKECAIPTTAPPTTTPPATTTPAPTTVPTTTPTTTPAPNRCPDHMKWDGTKCVERCPSTSLDDYKAWDPVLKKCVDPAAEPQTTTPAPYDASKNYCGPEGKASGPNKNLFSQASFNEGCYFHDNCYDACGEKKYSQAYCDGEFKRIMDNSCDDELDRLMNRCDSKAWYLKIPCTIKVRLQISSCWVQSRIYYHGVSIIGKPVGSYKCDDTDWA